jgi:hypothetical protein
MPTLNTKDIALLLGQTINNITISYGYKIDDVFKKQLYALMDTVFYLDLEMPTALFTLEQFERRLRYFKKIRQVYYTNLNPIIEIALASLMLGSKYGEELTVWNNDFLNPLPSITIKQLNQIEQFHLKALCFRAGLPLERPERRLSQVFYFFHPLHIQKIEKELQNYRHNKDTSPSVIHKAIFMSFKQRMGDRILNKALSSKSKDDFDCQPSKPQRMTLTFFESPAFPKKSKEEPESLHARIRCSNT